MVTPIELRSRAAAGAAFLDIHYPNWAKKISRPIRVQSTHECPLAQLHERYLKGAELYKLSETDTLELGFRADSREVGRNHNAFKEYYSQLNQAWEREKQKRA